MVQTIFLSTVAIAAGFALDLLLGDPPGMPHIVRFMGKLISLLEPPFRRLAGRDGKDGASAGTGAGLRRAGAFFAGTVMLLSAAIPFLLLFLAYRFLPPAALALETLFVWQLLAVRDLKVESMAVYRRLLAEDLPGARQAVARIVGRDTEVLDREGVARAAVETVAENTGDGVASPFFWIMLGGAVLGCCYKAANTMDSMIGYKNETYLNFGRFAAKLDDALNFLPSRLCAIFMIGAAFLLRLDGAAAFRIWRRDRRNHASPNSAQCEAACAGALGLRLAGPAYYEGVLEGKPHIGDDRKAVEAGDIVRVNRLLYVTAFLFFIFVMGVRVCCMAAMYSATKG